MPSTVGSYTVAPFTGPIDGTPNLAADVLLNDNALRTKFNAHESEAGIHIQSSTTGARPAAGAAGRLWYTTDDHRLWYDTGAAWVSAGYALAAHTHSAADLTSGTVPSARLTGAYTGITDVGPLTTLVVAGDPGGVEPFRVGGGARFGGSVAVGGLSVTVGAGVTGLAYYEVGDSQARLYINGGFLFIGPGGVTAASKVLGPRVTGWALPTGTRTRTTFDPATVTLPQLAERVAALLSDLHASSPGHGVIGA